GAAPAAGRDRRACRGRIAEPGGRGPAGWARSLAQGAPLGDDGRPLRGDHRVEGPGPGTGPAATATAPRADHVLHAALPRGGRRRGAADVDRTRLTRVPGPVTPALAGARTDPGGAVHPLLRARRAGASR